MPPDLPFQAERGLPPTELREERHGDSDHDFPTIDLTLYEPSCKTNNVRILQHFKELAMSHVPPYVYILFLTLLWMGISRCQPRTFRIERLLIMPILMAALGFHGFYGLFHSASLLDLLAGLCGGAIGVALGYSHVQAWAVTVNRAEHTVSVPGDVMMLVVILATFCFEFALHYLVESGAVRMSNLDLSSIAAALWMLFIGMSVGRNANLACRFWRSGEGRL
ncbi:DUF6622 family protein [Rhizobium oryzicola]|uniref:Uncharacterized protein n=1 Tax=Rhizobium oryzicola TaxID=1232668 RepID=A0ABT8T4A1_9HYPH|nr:DUF6622 family protein [Rhizobium oryzicola]MDO1585421.1 hypothetical protein [Rhizobium oryzicola]